MALRHVVRQRNMRTEANGYIVKNTFLECEPQAAAFELRRKSLPSSFQPLVKDRSPKAASVFSQDSTVDGGASSQASSAGEEDVHMTGAEVAEQFAGVVNTVKLALERNGLVSASEVIREGHDWCIRAYVEPDRMDANRKTLVGQARNIVIATTAMSQDVCVLGYQSKPFTPTPFGFQGTLALRNSPRVCHDAFALGRCQKGGSCSLLHPRCQSVLSVMLLPRQCPNEARKIGRKRQRASLSLLQRPRVKLATKSFVFDD